MGPRETIEFRLGVQPRFYSYPSGAYDDKAIAVIKSAGYWAGLTIEQGMTHRTSGLFELQRIRVEGRDTVDDLAAKLEYDW